MKKIWYISAILIICAFLFPVELSAKVTNLEANFPDFFGINDEGNDYQRTIAGLKQAIKADPENYENYGRLAFVYDYIGDYENVLETLKLEVKYMPEDLEDKDVIYGNLARAYILMGQPEQAKPWLDKADKSNPDNIFNRWHSLTYHIFKKNYKIAAKELKRLDKLNITDRDHYYEAYVYALEKIDDQDSIIKLFQQAVKVNPKSPLSHRALGTAIRNSSKEDYEKNMPQAMKELKIALKLDPKYIPTYISIADTFMLLAVWTKNDEHYKGALDWFNKGYELDSKNTRLAYATGNLFYYMQDYDNAIEKFEFALTNGLKGEPLIRLLALSYNNKAYAIYQSGENLDQGLELIDKAIELIPDDGIILGTKAEILYKLGKYQEAHKYIKQALELEPRHEEMKQDLVMIEEALCISPNSD